VIERGWRDALKVGDVVVCIAGRGERSLGKVTHATAKFVDVQGRRFRRDTGSEHGGSTWGSWSIEEATPEGVERVRHRIKIANAVSMLAGLPWYSLPDAVILATADAYRQARDAFAAPKQDEAGS
jgi:hypothetical protein